MSVFTRANRSAALVFLVPTSLATAGLVSVEVDFPGGFWSWEVPVLSPGQQWSASFAGNDGAGIVSVKGDIFAGVSPSGRSAWLTLTNVDLATTEAREVAFDFGAFIQFDMPYQGWASPTQIFRGDAGGVASSNARIDWAKGAEWNSVGLPPINGFYDPQELFSHLTDQSGIYHYFTGPFELVSETHIFMRSGGAGDVFKLPGSADDFIEIPGPGVLALLGGMIAVRRRR
jgi:hypothetical protein